MNSKDERDISFSDVIDNFSEDAVRAKEILKGWHRAQSQEGPPGLSQPFTDTSKMSAEDKEIVQEYLENQKQKKLSRDNIIEQPFSGPVTLPSSPPILFSPMQERINVVREIKRLNHPGEQGIDANAYELMLAVL